jgi:hypothetical protein
MYSAPLSTRFYLALILMTDLSLFLPPLRFAGSLLLICLLPGYFLAERLALWRNPLFAAVGSVGFSFLLSPLLTLPGCWLFHEINPWIIVIPINLFLLGLLFSQKNKTRVQYPAKEHSPFLPLLMMGICSWVFIYLDVTKLGPFAEDWTYLFGIIKELSRNMPPRNPENSFQLLKQPWGIWFLYALIHRLGGISAWQVLEFIPVPLSFVFMGFVYMVVYQITKDRQAGIWAILLLAIGRHSEWVIRGFQGLGWHPGYYTRMSWEFVQGVTGYSFLWGWYTLPGLIPPLMAFYFLIRYIQENAKKDLYLSLGICSVAPFFNPSLYLGFLVGLSLLFLFQSMANKFRLFFFLFYLTFIPYFLTFYLYFKPQAPAMPLYVFYKEIPFILTGLRQYLNFNGIAIPFAALALIYSREAFLWIFPFTFLFWFLFIFGWSSVNEHHVLLPDSLYISILSGIGLAKLKFSRWARIFVYALVLSVIIPPYVHEIYFRIKTGWKGTISSEQSEAGEFIRLYTDPNSSFVVFPDSQYSIDTVEGLGERKLVMGVTWHLLRYETSQRVDQWKAEAEHFFSTSNPLVTDRFVNKYKVGYIFLGPNEISHLKAQQVDIASYESRWTAVYKNQKIEILKTYFGSDR